MLRPEQIDKLPDNLVELYSQVEMDIISDISRRISTYDYFIPSAEWQYKKLLEMGNVHDDILKRLSELTGRTEESLEKLMVEAGYDSLKVDDKIYKKAGLNPTPIDQSPALMNVLEAGVKNTNGLFQNLTRTTANTTTKQFENILDNAYMQITSGAFDYNTAIRNAVKDLAGKGIASIQYPSGQTRYIESAVRTAVITGVGQTTGRLQEIRADEMGCDLMELTAHAGARDTGTGPANHAAWQGKIVSRSGRKGYLSLTDIGYGTGPGFKGWSCRHDWYPYFEGLSEPAYTDEELRQYNAKDYEYNGQKMTEYEVSQKQRYIERNIRRWKREYIGMEAAGLPTEESASKIAHWQNIQRDLIHQTGLKRQVDREQIAGFGKSEAQKVVSVNKRIAEFNKISGIKTSNDINITEVSKHFGQRAIQRNVSVDAVRDALTNPLKVGNIRVDKTQQFIGENATVAINTETGKVTTVWPTGKKRADKLKGSDKS